MTEFRRVLMSEELFLHLGASKVDWGEPDADGFYSPTLYARSPSLDVEGLAPLLAREFGKAGFFKQAASFGFVENQARMMLRDIAAEYDRLGRSER